MLLLPRTRYNDAASYDGRARQTSRLVTDETAAALTGSAHAI